MLNELLIVERGARQAGVEMASRHPDVKDARRVPTLLVPLRDDGQVAPVRPVASAVKPWTLRDGQHNSFPFVQPKQALWAVSEDDERRARALDKRNGDRREAILGLARDAASGIVTPKSWPGDGLLKRLHERRLELGSLEGTDAAVVLASIDRFLLACEPTEGGDPRRLLQAIAAQLVENLQETAGIEWIEIACALLLEGGGAFLFDATMSDDSSTLQPKMIGLVSAALKGQRRDAANVGGPRCGLTGEAGSLLTTPFPQPNLPLLGQTFLFARNKDTPSSGRYGRFAADTMPVGEETADRLSAAIVSLTSPERKGVTWCSIPGEARQQTDLLLAFVDTDLNAPVAAMLAGNADDEDLSEEMPAGTSEHSSIAGFEKRTQRVIDAVRAKLDGDFSRIPVLRLAVLRKVDPANRKVVHSDTRPVGALHEAAQDWAIGERNVPPWLALRVFFKGEREPRPMSPPHVAPLGMIAFSKQLFIRGGTERQEVVGLPAAEVLGLFLDPVGTRGDMPWRRIERALHLVLARRAVLVIGTAHATHRSFDLDKEFDRREVLRTVTILGVLLHKLGGTTRGGYMSDTAFKLGQLLAAADLVHAGYCADVRGGDVPPSLLGNQVFAMAQTAPTKALEVLCRRWKHYDGWVKKAAREHGKSDALVRSEKRVDQQRGWEIRKAVRHARDMRPLADELREALTDCELNDVFRAKLLLGYIAGLPKTRKEGESDDEVVQTTAEEN